MSHTPGPWRFTPYRNQLGASVHIPDIDNPISHLQVHSTVGMGSEEANANARLIAAAPDLLAACEFFMEFDGENCQTGDIHYDDVKAKIASAIAKARGK